MIEMGVGVNYGNHTQIEFFKQRKNLVGITTGIDDQRFSTETIANHRAIALQRPDRKGTDNKVGYWGCVLCVL